MAGRRDELIFLLNEAAEIEHSLVCRYLFAAFSLKKSVSEGVSWEEMRSIQSWGQTLFLIAREEMSHLGIACNLLTSIGAMPYFARRNFPYRQRVYPRLAQLGRFSEETLKTFICTERPEELRPEDAFCHEEDPSPDDSRARPVDYSTVGELYLKIRQIFEQSDESRLFIGPADAQVESSPEMGLAYPQYNVLRRGVFDVLLLPIADRKSAIHAIDRIIEQGEGTRDDRLHELSHFQRLLAVLYDQQKLKNAAEHEGRVFDPARNVVSNPALDGERRGVSLITDPNARALMKAFNAGNEMLLLILMRFYAHTDETADDIAALRYMLFPMMSMCIRPLGEVLTELPAFEGLDGERCGPGFELLTAPQFLPHRQSAWAFLTEKAKDFAAVCADAGRRPGMPPRVAYIAQTAGYMASRFESLLTTGNVTGAEHIF